MQAESDGAESGETPLSFAANAPVKFLVQMRTEPGNGISVTSAELTPATLPGIVEGNDRDSRRGEAPFAGAD